MHFTVLYCISAEDLNTLTSAGAAASSLLCFFTSVVHLKLCIFCDGSPGFLKAKPHGRCVGVATTSCCDAGLYYKSERHPTRSHQTRDQCMCIAKRCYVAKSLKDGIFTRVAYSVCRNHSVATTTQRRRATARMASLTCPLRNFSLWSFPVTASYFRQRIT